MKKTTKDIKAIVIGGSAGSFSVVTRILESLPPDFNIPIILSLHRLKNVKKGFQEALQLKSKLKIVEPNDKESVRNGKVYLAPANYHLCMELGNSFSLSTEPMVNNSRPAIDLTFQSASYVYKHKMIGVILSGANKDGAKGLKSVSDKGGITIVQDPKECVIDTMTRAAIEIAEVDYVLNVDGIIEFLNKLK